MPARQGPRGWRIVAGLVAHPLQVQGRWPVAVAAAAPPPPLRRPAARARPPPPARPLARLLQGSTARRDLLLSLQDAAQSKWEAARAFEVDAPAQGAGGPDEKFFGTFPYPYMNGVLHLGHAFSLSKLEFAAAYHRLCGKNVLFPQGFHCTGMPIKVGWEAPAVRAGLRPCWAPGQKQPEPL